MVPSKLMTTTARNQCWLSQWAGALQTMQKNARIWKYLGLFYCCRQAI